MNKNKSTAAIHQSTQSPLNKKGNVHFEFLGKAGSQVFVAGTFNNRSTIANPLRNNPDSSHFKAVLRVPAGMHEYKFVVNDEWIEDPKCGECVQNIYGSQNCLQCV